MPVNPENQKTLGYCFIEYTTQQVIPIKFISFTKITVNGVGLMLQKFQFMVSLGCLGAK